MIYIGHCSAKYSIIQVRTLNSWYILAIVPQSIPSFRWEQWTHYIYWPLFHKVFHHSGGNNELIIYIGHCSTKYSIIQVTTMNSWYIYWPLFCKVLDHSGENNELMIYIGHCSTKYYIIQVRTINSWYILAIVPQSIPSFRWEQWTHDIYWPLFHKVFHHSGGNNELMIYIGHCSTKYSIIQVGTMNSWYILAIVPQRTGSFRLEQWTHDIYWPLFHKVLYHSG